MNSHRCCSGAATASFPFLCLFRSIYSDKWLFVSTPPSVVKHVDENYDKLSSEILNIEFASSTIFFSSFNFKQSKISTGLISSFAREPKRQFSSRRSKSFPFFSQNGFAFVWKKSIKSDEKFQWKLVVLFDFINLTFVGISISNYSKREMRKVDFCHLSHRFTPCRCFHLSRIVFYINLLPSAFDMSIQEKTTSETWAFGKVLSAPELKNSR